MGQTVCPGKYLYPYLPRVRARVAELLTPAIGGVTLSNPAQLVTDPAAVTMGMTVPAGSLWSITVRDVDGNTVGQSTGTTTETGPVSFNWAHVDATPALLPEGVYTASFDVTHGTSTLPTVTRTIALASVPQAPSGLSLRRRTSTSKTVSWNVVVNASPVSYSYRLIDTTAGVTRSWSTTTARATSVRVSRLKARHRYRLEVTAGNALGTSPIASVQFVQ